MTPPALKLDSAAFQPLGEIPTVHTCEGQDTSPPLSWTGVPRGAVSLVLIVDDPDAPDPRAPQMTWVHWVVYNIPADVTGMAAGEKPRGAQGLNDFKKHAYGGPCPPIGRHRYVFKLYALDRMLADVGRATKADVEKAMQGHILAHAELVGLYQKQGR